MKAKTISKIIDLKINQWLDSITDIDLRLMALDKVIVTGGCITSMLLDEEVNDFDVYFSDVKVTKAIAEYYAGIMQSKTGYEIEVLDSESKLVKDNIFQCEENQIRCHISSRGVITSPDYVDEDSDLVKEPVIDKNVYEPVYISSNAITLTDKIQIITRFSGDVETLHENYDFIHCTNYWKSSDGKVVLKEKALESILTKELRYVGSKYPICSVVRLRKFIKRGWTINAGQILKMCFQISLLDLSDIRVLEEATMGVDAAYFIMLIRELKEKNPDKVDATYIMEIIDRVF